jgi:hypothetical protein
VSLALDTIPALFMNCTETVFTPSPDGRTAEADAAYGIHGSLSKTPSVEIRICETPVSASAAESASETFVRRVAEAPPAIETLPLGALEST